MPFGMRNAGQTFQRVINSVIADIDQCEAYIDDIVVFSNTFEEHIVQLTNLFRKLSEVNFTVNLHKSDFCKGSITYLGYQVGTNQVRPIEAKVDAIVRLPPPKNCKEIKKFLGMAGYYRRFCQNFSAIAEPLTALLKKGVEFEWSNKCQEAFLTIKSFLSNAPVMAAPNFSKPFKLAIDASNLAIGSVLFQEDNMGIDHPIAFFSRKLNENQKNYSTIEKEALALVLSLQHFEVYVSSSTNPVRVFSDHDPLKFTSKLGQTNQRILRWCLYFQNFNLEISHIKGSDNVVADCLSRM
jgi:hypothetical protein